MTEEQTTDEQVIADLTAECVRLKWVLGQVAATIAPVSGVETDRLASSDGLLAEVRRLVAIIDTRDALARENARLRRLVPQDQKLPVA